MGKRATGSRTPLPATPDAVDVAMDIVGHDDVARTLLEKHSRLIDAQVRNERLEHANKRAMIAFRSVLAIVALAAVLGFGWMVMDARNDRGLVIDALSVPPDLAQRGLTGEALASNLADKLAEIDRTARSFRSPETMTVNWGNEVKIQIPETGVSIGEVDAFLRRTLGGQTTIGGAVFRTPQGLRLTVRAGGSGAVEQVGTDANLEAMIQKAAEGVFAQTQTYRYSKYLEFKGRTDEAMKVVRDLAATSDDPKERAWAWAQISNLLILTDTNAALAAAYRGIREDPSNPLVYLNGTIAAGHLSHYAESNRLGKIAGELGSNPDGGLSEIGVNTSRANLAFLPVETGDFNLVLKNLDALSGPLYPGLREKRDSTRAYYLLVLHDPRAARRLTGPVSDAAIAAQFPGSAGSGGGPNYDLAMEEGDYDRAALLTRKLLEFLKTNPETPHVSAVQSERFVLPDLATALAFGGHLDEARGIVERLPLDCVNCLAARGTVSGLSGEVAGARKWAMLALRGGAPPVFVHAGLARLDLQNRRWGDALAEADKALAAGPNYADAHKYRGDALRRLGRRDEAVAAYRKAADLAPAWGRLRIDWGLAELGRGDRKAAARQFDAASRLFLRPTDQKVLAGLRPFASPMPPSVKSRV